MDQLDSITADVRSAFVSGGFYSLRQTKLMLQAIYDNHGTLKNAKATDLKGFVECVEKQMTIDGTRMNGYVIRSLTAFTISLSL